MNVTLNLPPRFGSRNTNTTSLGELRLHQLGKRSVETVTVPQTSKTEAPETLTSLQNPYNPAGITIGERLGWVDIDSLGDLSPKDIMNIVDPDGS
ncbi:hypothetical protein, partial [Brucella intermedia]|uniref:hypothetical protein n=1 Tax=Brucella intermedia TaxID=94625 RepID=UPI0023628EEC